MKTNRFLQAVTAALLLAAAPTRSHAASLLADGNLDTLPAGTRPDVGAPAGHWFLSPQDDREENVPSQVSIAPAPAGGTGNALRYSLAENENPGESVDCYNTLARPVTAASGQIVNMSFDIYVEPGAAGPSLYLGTDGQDQNRTAQLSWFSDGALRTRIPGIEITLVPAYPRGVWQTVRLTIDLASQRWNFEWSEKGQPVSVTRSNLAFHSATPVLSLNQLVVIRFVSFTAAARGYLDNIQISAGPPAAVMPAHSIVAPGSSVALSPTNTLAVSSTYQWQLHGTNLPGATSSNLALSNLTLEQSGPYSVIVSNAYEVVTATAAQVEVVDRVTISSQPRGATVINGTNVTLSVSAVSPLPISYQWQFNGTDLPGQTGATLPLSNVQPINEGVYAVVATDALGSVTSEPAVLTVWVKPAFVQAPISQSVVVGGSVTFSTEITGNPAPFTYQWRQGSTTLTNMVQTGKKAFFTLNNVQTNQGGTYRVVIVNPAAPTVGGSSPNTTWTLTVLADTDGDGLPDAWETAHGLSTTADADAALDNDGDGHSNLAEYRAGTNPTNAASHFKIEIVTQANGAATVSFNALSNQTYTVEWCGALDGAWTKLTDLIARTNSRVESVTDNTAADAARFYRVMTPRRP